MRNATRDRAGTRPCAPTGRTGAAARRRWRRRARGSSRGNARRPRAAARRSRRTAARSSRAALTEICWPTIARASVVNGSLRRRRWMSGIGADQLAQHAVALRRARASPRPSRRASAMPACRDRRSARRGAGANGTLRRRFVFAGSASPDAWANGTLRRVRFGDMTCSRGRVRLAALVAAVARCRARRAAAAAADPNKVLRDRVSDRRRTGFDPVRVSRPLFGDGQRGDLRAAAHLRLPRAAGEARADGRRGDARGHRQRQDLHVPASRKGIYFTPDPAFKGAKRELVAQDFVYSFMRFVDPKNRSPYAFLLEGKIEGLDELAAKAKKTGKFDYDAKVAGHGGRRPLHAALPAQARPTTTSPTSPRTCRSAPWRAK